MLEVYTSKNFVLIRDMRLLLYIKDFVLSILWLSH